MEVSRTHIREDRVGVEKYITGAVMAQVKKYSEQSASYEVQTISLEAPENRFQHLTLLINLAYPVFFGEFHRGREIWRSKIAIHIDSNRNPL
jgi:hypothetical protein